MQHTEIDHLVVVADTLDQGAAWCEATLGAASVPGGRHALMGTHNRLLKISNQAWPQAYLEIIAIDPDAPPPGRARWFGMDDAALQARVRAQGPELVGYVARSAMVDIHRWGLINCRLQPGATLKASRETAAGLLQWQIVITEDGRLMAGGAVPTLIQWQGPHPTDSLPDSPVQLAGLSLSGLPDQAAQVLRLRGVQRVAAAPGAGPASPAVQATLQTPRGPVTLSTFVSTTTDAPTP